MASGHRAQWKGFLKFGEVSCGVALYTAASTSERITFNTINKATGNRALRDGMKKSNVAAIARAVLFRRMRSVLIRPYGKGLVATTMNYDYEVRSSKKAFEEVPKLKIEGEMLDLAKHIISTKKGTFDPATFDDRYEAALAELVKAKIEGKALPTAKKVKASKPNDLLAALRESAGLLKSGDPTESKPKRTAANANKGTGRQRAARGVAAKAASSKAAPQRKAS